MFTKGRFVVVYKDRESGRWTRAAQSRAWITELDALDLADRCADKAVAVRIWEDTRSTPPLLVLREEYLAEGETGNDEPVLSEIATRRDLWGHGICQAAST